MNPTSIEYCHKSWNPISGCKIGCDFCYARRISRRWGRSFEPSFWPDRLRRVTTLRKPSIVFACDMGDINSPGVEDSWREKVYKAAAEAKKHQFLFLTKNPYEWLKSFYFPPEEAENIWLGTSITKAGEMSRLVALDDLDWPRKYIQFEPLLGEIALSDLGQYFAKDRPRGGFKWIIVGGATKYQVKTRPEWVAKIVNSALVFGVPLFVKNNAGWPAKIRQFPEGLDELAGDLK